MIGGLVPRPERDQIVRRLELDILRVDKTVGLAQRLGLSRRQGFLETLHCVQEHQLLVSGPGCYVRCLGLEVFALPLIGKLVADVDKRRVKFGLGRQPCTVELLLPVDRGNLVFEACVFGSVEELKVCVLEVVLVQGLPRPLREVERDELVKGLSAYQTLKVPDKMEALFVGNGREGVIWVNWLPVFPFVADVEFRKLVVCTKAADCLLCDSVLVLSCNQQAQAYSLTKCFPSDDG